MGIVLSFFGLIGLKPTDGVTLFAGLGAAAIIWWQGHLIKQQMQLSAIIDLDKEWNSAEMLDSRAASWTADHHADLDTIEGALEFLEKVSTLEKQGVISTTLVWDTFGWYIWRYYFYSKREISRLRKKWTSRPDPTLYQDLEALFRRLLKMEIDERNDRRRRNQSKLTTKDVLKELRDKRNDFIECERSLSNNE